jgi:hypothetical protein
MKNTILKSVLALLMAFIALPMMGQNYLKIYFKDGHTERHFMHLVNNIAMTKYDLDGYLHSDYQMQQIIMEDTTYSYYIADIDSMTFRKVDEDQILQNFTSALSKIDNILENCDSFNDIYRYSDEISKASGIEKVDVYDNAIVVRVKDWLDIVFFDIPKKKSSTKETYTRHLKDIMSKNAQKGPQINQSIHVAIADQNAKTEGSGYVASTKCLHEIEDEFSKMGYDVEYIPQPGLDFFRKNIFEYDVIMLTTHGGFIDGKHWFATGLEIEEYNSSMGWSKDDLEKYYNKHNDLEDIKFLYLSEVRDGENKWVLYNICSEDYINKSPHQFKNKNAILFTNVCHSLDKNNKVADIFFGKGASTYLGYVNSTAEGEYAGKQFFVDYMLNGTSTEYAFNHLSENYIKESNGATLHRKAKDKDKDYFITKTITAPSSKVKSQREENGTYLVTFYGYTTMRQYTGDVKMGFLFSNNSDMSNATDAPVKSNYEDSDDPNGNYCFYRTLTVNPETTIFYQAYTYDDGMTYNYGDIQSFKTEKLPELELSERSFTLNVGRYTIIDILTGSGQYDIFNGNDKVVTVTVEGKKMVIDAIGAGTVTIIVTDKKTGQTASIEGRVWDNLSIAIWGNIDLDVGGSANVRINSGNDDYTLESSNPKVATASIIGYFINVQALSEGTATITVTDNKTGQKASFTVTVKGGLEKLVLSTYDPVTMNVNSGLSFMIISGSGNYSVASSNESVASVRLRGNYVDVSALSPGHATITVTDVVSGEKASIEVTVTGQTDTRELMFTKKVGSTVYSMYKKTLSDNDYHINPDGWKCYRSELSLDITKNGNTNTYVVDNNIYLDKKYDHHGGQQPCMLLDFNKNMMYIFCNSKDDGPYYSMDGNFYSSSMNNIHFSKETVFEGANWGWYPYFCDYGDNNIYLCNFSFAGYFTIMAVREGGTWELYYYNTDISPEQATREWEIAGPVLVIGQEEVIDERIPTVIPDEIRDEIEQYIPIYDGVDPPNIEGTYYLSPQILFGSSRSNDQIGKEYSSEYQKYSNQDMVNNTIDMVRVQGGGSEWHKGSGAFISGSGNNFTIYFDMSGESNGIKTKRAFIVSGTKTDAGIKNLTTGFIMKEKGPDPDHKLVEVGTYRFFKDKDGMSEATSWPYGTQYDTKKRVKQANSLPNSLDR